jgi:2-methylcitrate dehydratase
MGMHFKLGLYEHQSAGAIGGLIQLLAAYPALLNDADAWQRIEITIYQPAFGIIGDPAKRDPHTRQSADHSMVYIIATLLRKALQTKQASWRELMLVPADYSDASLHDPLTRKLMGIIDFRHGGPEYDAKYPDGIPTTLEIQHATLGKLSSGLVMYPTGHARCKSGNLTELLLHKFRTLAALGVEDVESLHEHFTGLAGKSVDAICTLYDFAIRGVE